MTIDRDLLRQALIDHAHAHGCTCLDGQLIGPMLGHLVGCPAVHPTADVEADKAAGKKASR